MVNSLSPLLIFPLFLCLQSSFASKEATVEIESGVQIRGSQMTTLNQRKFYAFLGIPYAEPPVGNLRFKAPVPKKWTKNFFDATKNSPSCVQSNLLSFTFKEITGQEDCLILNVFTHNIEEPLRKVMIFIHGGAFIMGSGNEYGPRRLLDRNVVLVTINYRLGPLGFLSTLDEASPGNYGLLDQTEAFKWIKRNIAAFGGDPNKITIFGESAGSASVINHMISPLSKGLFHRAIGQSGNVFCPWAEQVDPLKWTTLLAHKVGCLKDNTKAIVNCLRETSVEKIITAADEMNVNGTLTQFGPVADGYFHSELPSQLLKNGKIANKVPLVFGVTKDEGMFFVPFVYQKGAQLSDDVISKLLATTINVGSQQIPRDLVKLIKNQYFSSIDTKDEKKLLEIMSQVISDGAFVADHYNAVQLLLGAGVKLFLYSHDYVTDHSAINAMGLRDTRAVVHVDDLFFLFDAPFLFPEHHERPNDRTESNFLDIWTSFAEYGYPVEETANGVVHWKSATSNFIHVYHMDEVITVRNYDPRSDWRLEFWSKKVPSVLRNVKKAKEEL